MMQLLDKTWKESMLGPIRQVDAFHDILAHVNAHAHFRFEETLDVLDYNDRSANEQIQERVIRHRAERLMYKAKERAIRYSQKEEKVADAIEQGILKPRNISTFTRLPVTTVYRLKSEYLANGRAGIQSKLSKMLAAEQRLGDQAMAIKAII
jgi:hypothetical protein